MTNERLHAFARVAGRKVGFNMKIYVATGLERAAEARALAEELERHGHTITYKWYLHGSVQRDGPERIAEVAALEVNGVLTAEVFIALLPGGRGTHVELGIAIADALHRTKRVFVVGPLAGKDGLECAFYRAPGVERLTSTHDLLQALLLEREVDPMTTETHPTQVDILTCTDREQCEVVACLTHERDELRDALNDAMLNRGKGKDYAERLLTAMAKHYGASSACEIMRKERDEARVECKRLRGIIDSQPKELAELRRAGAMVDCIRTWIQHERQVREAHGKGGQSVGDSPRLPVQVLRDFERMLLPDEAAYVLGNWDAQETELSVLRKEHAAAVALLAEYQERHVKTLPSCCVGYSICEDATRICELDDILAGRGPTP